MCVCLDSFGVAMRSGQAGDPQTDACLMLKVLKQGRPNFWFPYNVGPTTITWVFKKSNSCNYRSVRMFYVLKDFVQITSDIMSWVLQSLLLGRFDFGAMIYV